MHSIYLHIPFCRHRCAYCDFNTYAGMDAIIDDYVSALALEIAEVGQKTPAHTPIHTVFFGGGTPSLLTLEQHDRLMVALQKHFNVLTDAEITLEANPGTIDLDYLRGLRNLGINRLSFGMQSAHPADLQLLEREHDTYQVIQAVQWARQAGFDNLNLDLIFGLPHQPLERWQASLELALGLGADHYALYSLILEHGTPMNRWVGRGLMPAPDPDLAGDMYEWSLDRMQQAGYQHYEISNWARNDRGDMLKSCRHNEQYWLNRPYFGLGAGAHGYVDGLRTSNALAPAAYIKRMNAAAPKQYPRSAAAINAAPVSAYESMAEHMMMGLRLVKSGVNASEFMTRYEVALESVFEPQLQKLSEWGLLAWQGQGSERRLCLTRRGLLLGNRVFMEFVGD
jgi:oxygen-independent coproporphyrinogen-3 oxidase